MSEKFTMNEAHKKSLTQCRKNSPTCFDCGAQNPAWASIHFGILVCFDCAGSHRQMGTHISFVRSTAFDGWKEDHLKKMIVGGNSRAAKYFRKYGANPRKKTQSFAQFYDTKVARRYKEQLTDDARNHVLETPVSPQTSPTTGGSGQLDKLISGLKLQSTGVSPAPPPIAKTVLKQSPRVPEAKQAVVTTVVKKSVVSKKTKPKVKKKAFAGKKKTTAMKLGAKKKTTGFLVEDDSTDFDKSSDEEQPGQQKQEDDPFGQSQKQKPKAAPKKKQTTSSSDEVKRVFEKKYGKKVRGGSKKMTSIGSDDFFNDDPEAEARKAQFTNARAIGSDAYFGREQATGPPKTEIDWDDIRGEASAKVERLTEAAGDWFSSLTSKLSQGR